MKWAFISGDRLDLISHMMLGGRGEMEKIRWRREGGIYLRSARRSPSSSSPSSRGGRTLHFHFCIGSSHLLFVAPGITRTDPVVSPPLLLTTSPDWFPSRFPCMTSPPRCTSDVASLQLEKVKLVLLKIIFCHPWTLATLFFLFIFLHLMLVWLLEHELNGASTPNWALFF